MCSLRVSRIATYDSRVVNRARAFRAGRALTWILINCQASIGQNARAKLRFLVSERVFAIAHCINIAVRSWYDCKWVRPFCFS